MMAPPPKRVRTTTTTFPHSATEEDAENNDTPATSAMNSILPSPTLQLTGHTGSVYALAYDPTGETLCSASFDMTCLLWNHPVVDSTYNSNSSYANDDDEHYPRAAAYENFNVLTGHTNAVLDCDWCDVSTVVTCAADRTAALWDIVTGTRIRKYADATAVVNAVSVVGYGRSEASSKSMSSSGIPANQFVTVSDDGLVRLYDCRQKPVAAVFVAHAKPTHEDGYPILAVAATAGSSSSNCHKSDNNDNDINDNSNFSQPRIFTAGLDNCITAWDVRALGQRTHAHASPSPLYVLGAGYHSDTITSLSLNPTHTQILSNSMDQTLQIWNINPYVVGDEVENSDHTGRLPTSVPMMMRSPSQRRHVRTMTGHTHYGSTRSMAGSSSLRNTMSGGALLKCAWNADGSLVSAGSTDALVHIWDTYSGQELYTLPGHSGAVNAVAFHPHHVNLIASGASDKQIYVGELLTQ